MRAVSAPGRIGNHSSEAAQVAVKRGSTEISCVPLASLASHMIRQSGIEVSATLLAQKTIAFALRKSTDSCPVKKPPPFAGFVGSTST